MKNKFRKILKSIGISSVILALGLASVTAVLAASEYTFTTAGEGHIVNEAYIVQGRYVSASGTGLFDPFLRVHKSNSPIEQGYNSDYENKSLEFQEDEGWTKSFLLRDVPLVELPTGIITDEGEVPTGIYREIHLDVNQSSGGDSEFLSLDKLEIYISDYEVSADLRRYTSLDPMSKQDPYYPGGYTALFPDELTRYKLAWDLDAGSDNWLYMDYSLEAGSGKSDLVFYFPESVFEAVGYHDNSYFILYCLFGEHAENNDGFEEFKVFKYPATKAGYKFNDLNGNGIRETGEDYLDGWEIRAYAEITEDGLLDQDEYDAGPVATATTEATTGAYTLYPLDPGPYVIVEVMQPDWIQSSPPDSTSVLDPLLDTGLETLGEIGYAVYLGNGALDLDNHFGNYSLGCLEVTKEIDWTGIIGDPADVPDVDFTVTVEGPSYPLGIDLIFHLVDGVVYYDDEMDATACLCSLIPGDYYVTEIAPAGWSDPVITNDDPATVAAGTECGIDAIEVIVTNTLLIPNTTIFIEPDVWETTPGGNVWLYISELNDGQVPITSPSVTLESSPAVPGLPIDLLKGDANWSEGPSGSWALNPGANNGDTNGDGVLDVGETWYWAVQVTISADTDFTVIGHGFDPLGNPVDGGYEPGEYPSEIMEITVEVDEMTRTWGFWKTHLWLVEWMFTEGHFTPINLGDWDGLGPEEDRIVDSVCTYMGLMWSKQTHNANGDKRANAIDVARIHTAHQAVAAFMNQYIPGGASIPYPSGYASAADWIYDVMTNGNTRAIRDLGSELAAFNESGDDIAFDPSVPPTGRTNNADPQGARAAGEDCAAYWDTEARVKAQGQGRGRQ
jgi:hypothetical protein